MLFFFLLAKHVFHVHSTTNTATVPALELLQTLLTVPVIDFPLLLIHQDLVGCKMNLIVGHFSIPQNFKLVYVHSKIFSKLTHTIVDLGKPQFGFLIVGVLVRMVFQCKLVVRPLELLL